MKKRNVPVAALGRSVGKSFTSKRQAASDTAMEFLQMTAHLPRGRNNYVSLTLVYHAELNLAEIAPDFDDYEHSGIQLFTRFLEVVSGFSEYEQYILFEYLCLDVGIAPQHWDALSQVFAYVKTLTPFIEELSSLASRHKTLTLYRGVAVQTSERLEGVLRRPFWTEFEIVAHSYASQWQRHNNGQRYVAKAEVLTEAVVFPVRRLSMAQRISLLSLYNFAEFVIDPTLLGELEVVRLVG